MTALSVYLLVKIPLYFADVNVFSSLFSSDINLESRPHRTV